MQWVSFMLHGVGVVSLCGSIPNSLAQKHWGAVHSNNRFEDNGLHMLELGLLVSCFVTTLSLSYTIITCEGDYLHV